VILELRGTSKIHSVIKICEMSNILDRSNSTKTQYLHAVLCKPEKQFLGFVNLLAARKS
jgi:hypothetical protein